MSRLEGIVLKRYDFPSDLPGASRAANDPCGMRVLHVIRGLANSSGTTHIVVQLAEEQARQGADVTVFYVEKPGQLPVMPDMSLVESREFALSLPFSNPGVSREFARAMERQTSNFDFVHIHAVWNYPTYCAMRAAARARVPYMVAPQGSFEPWALARGRWRKRVYGRLTEVPLLNRAACLQALSSTEARQFRDYGLTAPCQVIPNGIDPDCFDRPAAPLAETLGLPRSEKTLLFLSRLHPKKGADILLRGFADFSAHRSDVTLVVAGDDAGSGYRARLEALARQLGTGDKCRFIGEVRDTKKYETFLGADAFALTSHSEGLPIAVLEAMGAGLPVLITPGCNLPEVQALGAGLIADPEPAAVAGALDRLFAGPDEMHHMGTAARRLVGEKFTWRAIARLTLATYADIRRQLAS